MGGRVVHFEIPFDEGDRARTFYRSVFGWSLQSMPDMGYTMVQTGPVTEEGMPTEVGYIGGGMMERQEAVPTPVITIEVDDIDESLKSVGEHGGSTVMERFPVGEMGFAAYFRDSEGNLLGLWQNAS
jgi:uncharacterized protein